MLDVDDARVCCASGPVCRSAFGLSAFSLDITVSDDFASDDGGGFLVFSLVKNSSSRIS